MRCLLIICLFVLAGRHVESSVEKADVPSVEKCEPGTHWKEDCNFCFCLDDGVGACTRMFCHGHQEGHEQLKLPSGKYCLSGSSWNGKCYSCQCNDKGVSVCTFKPCLPNKIARQNDCTVPDDLKLCAPTTMWKNDCNSCWCTDNGVPLCTLMACDVDLHRE